MPGLPDRRQYDCSRKSLNGCTSAVLAGPFLTVSAVWTIAEILNGFMAIPNLIALLVLNGVVATETKSFFARLKDDPTLNKIK